MTDQPKRGKRVQIYLPADLLVQWERIPRYERSATVAAALREYWGKPDTQRNSGLERGTDQSISQQDAE